MGVAAAPRVEASQALSSREAHTLAWRCTGPCPRGSRSSVSAAKSTAGRFKTTRSRCRGIPLTRSRVLRTPFLPRPAPQLETAWSRTSSGGIPTLADLAAGRDPRKYAGHSPLAAGHLSRAVFRPSSQPTAFPSPYSSGAVRSSALSRASSPLGLGSSSLPSRVSEGRKCFVPRAAGLGGDAGSQSDGEDPEDPVSVELQRMLVRQVRLQMGELQVTELVDESARRLRNTVRDGMGQELDRIAIRAMRGADDFSNRVLKQLDASALAIERDLILARKEMEAREKEFEKFQMRAYHAKNEGLFFKGLYSPPQPLSRSKNSNNSMSSSKSRAASSSSGSRQRRANSPAPSASVGSAVVGPTGSPSDRAPRRDEADDAEEAAALFKQVLYLGLSLTCVSFLWSSASALLMEGHFMSFRKLVEYAAVFTGFVIINSGFESSTAARPPPASEEQETSDKQ